MGLISGLYTPFAKLAGSLILFAGKLGPARIINHQSPSIIPTLVRCCTSKRLRELWTGRLPGSAGRLLNPHDQHRGAHLR